MTWDIRYFWIDAAAAGLTWTGTSLTVPAGAQVLAGEVGGAEFTAITNLNNGILMIRPGVTTLTGPDGQPATVLAAKSFAGPALSVDGAALPAVGTTVLVYLDGGTLAVIEATASENFSGILPDTASFAAEVTLTDSNLAFTALNLTGSFGGAAGMTCFVAGTGIATPAGPVPVEALRPGDLVLTRDHGAQPLRWCGARQVTAARLARAERLRPVRIAAGALGPGRPARDLWLSQQHRLLCTGAELRRRFDCAEVLVAARHLVGMPGIAIPPPAGMVRYHHLLFDRHEIVQADGAWAESLYTGPMALRSLPVAQRAEIVALFPGLAAGGAAHAAPARRFLTGAEARALVAAGFGRPGPA